MHTTRCPQRESAEGHPFLPFDNPTRRLAQSRSVRFPGSYHWHAPCMNRAWGGCAWSPMHTQPPQRQTHYRLVSTVFLVALLCAPDVLATSGSLCAVVVEQLFVMEDLQESVEAWRGGVREDLERDTLRRASGEILSAADRIAGDVLSNPTQRRLGISMGRAALRFRQRLSRRDFETAPHFFDRLLDAMGEVAYECHATD